MKSIRIIFCFFFLFLLVSCSKNTNYGGIPLVSVNFDIYPANPMYSALNPVGGWVYVNGGSRGIIIYHYTLDEFHAYDRHCTYQPQNSCGRVKVSSDNITLVDTCCGSKFVIVDGSVLNGPAGMSLKQYQCTYDGTTLHVSN